MIVPEPGTFDFNVEAELFPAYRRFARAADAIRSQSRSFRLSSCSAAFLEVDGERYRGEEIRCLYDSTDFPLPRRAAPRQQ
jgi:hypothetical protein